MDGFAIFHSDYAQDASLGFAWQDDAPPTSYPTVLLHLSA